MESHANAWKTYADWLGVDGIVDEGANMYGENTYLLLERNGVGSYAKPVVVRCDGGLANHERALREYLQTNRSVEDKARESHWAVVGPAHDKEPRLFLVGYRDGSTWTEAAGSTKGTAAQPVEGDAGTSYTVRVPEPVRKHAASLFAAWVADGQPDDGIADLVKSVVLSSYCAGEHDGALPNGLGREVADERLVDVIRCFLDLEQQRDDEARNVPVFDVRLDAGNDREDNRDFRVRVTSGPFGVSATEWRQVLDLAEQCDLQVTVQNNGIELAP